MANWDAFPVAEAAAPDPWSAFPKADAAPPEKPKMGAARAATRGAAKGFMFGLADEATAAAAASPLPGAQMAAQSGAPNFHPFDVAAGAGRMLLERVAPSVFGKTGGEAYDERLAKERELDRQAMAEQPVASIAGNIAGGIANPIARALPSVGFREGLKGGAIAGGLYGFGEGEGADRLRTTAVGTGVGALVGGPLGALAGKLGAPRQAPQLSPIAEAGERLGVPIPRYMASESMPVQRLAAVERNIPFAGDRLVKAFDDVKQGVTGAADDVAARLGGSQPQQAGERASAAILDYMGPQLKAVSNRNYKAVDKLVAPNAGMLHPLNETQAAVSNILGKRFNAGVEQNGAAVNAVADAIKRRGLTYDGLKELRTRFGTKVSDDVTQDVIGAEFKQIYGALTKDLENAVGAAGGKQATAAWRKANTIHQLAMERRAALEKIVGVSGDNAGEKVFEKLASMASSTARGDMQTLLKARKAMGPDAWKEFTGTVISRIGRDKEGMWTPDRFVTEWGKMSESGKTALFGSSGSLRQSIDDILTISSTMKDRYAKFGNPSGTSQNAAGISFLGGVFIDPVTAVATVLGNRAVATALAQPATASSMAKWARAYQSLVTKPAAGSLAAFQQASRNFANTLGEKMGLNVDPMTFLRAMQNHAPARADGEEQ